MNLLVIRSRLSQRCINFLLTVAICRCWRCAVPHLRGHSGIEHADAKSADWDLCSLSHRPAHHACTPSNTTASVHRSSASDFQGEERRVTGHLATSIAALIASYIRFNRCDTRGFRVLYEIRVLLEIVREAPYDLPSSYSRRI